PSESRWARRACGDKDGRGGRYIVVAVERHRDAARRQRELVPCARRQARHEVRGDRRCDLNRDRLTTAAGRRDRARDGVAATPCVGEDINSCRWFGSKRERWAPHIRWGKGAGLDKAGVTGGVARITRAVAVAV